MFPQKVIVLDANILVRAILGSNVINILNKYNHNSFFCTPEYCYEEANRHLPMILEKRGVSVDVVDILDKLSNIVRSINYDVFSVHKETAQKRISSRDINDWPIVALALAMNCPIWTEDSDFFGSGIATWRTHNIEIFLQD
jgi:predicted nucleic acid-binding protein